MKGFSKLFGFISAIIATLAIILIIVGICTGGTTDAFKVLNTSDIGIFNSIGYVDNDIDDSGMNRIEVDEMEFNKGEIQNITIHAHVGKYEIKTWDEEQYKVVVTKQHNKLKYSVQDGTLKITYSNKQRFTRWRNLDVEVTVYVPKDTKLENTVLDIGAGEFTCNEISVSNLVLQVGAGEATFDNLLADNVTFDVGVGEVMVTDSAIKTSNVDVGAGNFEMNAKIEGDLKIECGIGNVEIQADNEYEEYNYTLQVGIGNISIDGEDYSHIGADKKIDNHADKKIDIDCGLGNVSVDFK